MRPLDPRVLAHLRPAARPLSGVVAAGVVGSVLLVAQTFAVAHLVVVVVRGDTPEVGTAALLVVAAVVARAVAGLAGDVAAARAAATVSRDLRRRLVAAVLGLPSSELSRHRAAELSLLVTRGVTAVEPYLTRYLPSLVLAVVLPPLTLLAIASQDLLAAGIVVLTLPLVPVFAVLVGLTTRDRAERQWLALSSLAGHFVDVVHGLPTLVVHRRARAQSATIRRVTDRHRRATVDTLRLAFASSAVLELVATLSVALVAVLVGLRLATGGLDLGTALVVLLLAPEAYWPLRRVGAEFHAAAEGTATFEQAQAVLDLAAQRDGSPVAGPGAAAPTAVDLVVRYPGRTVPALDLRGRRVRLPRRGLVAVTGPSGSGKSTLLLALAGEVRATEGRLVPAPRGDVAWVPQRPWVDGGSVRDNLVLGCPDTTDAGLWDALAVVGLRELVAGLPQGLDAPVGPDGDLLSAGQRARLSLARAVVADRPLVLADEPTAHLDPDSEQAVLQALHALATRSTVVLVTHSRVLVEAADRVVRLTAAAPKPAASVPAVPTRAAAPGPAAVTAPPPEPSPAPLPGPSPVPPPGPSPGPGTDVADPAADRGPSRWSMRWSSRWRWPLSVLLGVLASACGVALTVTSGWLITRASQHPPILFLMVAIVGVRAFGIGRPVLRYAERTLGHDSVLRMLAAERARVYDVVVPLTPGALGRRRGDVLATLVDDVDALLDERLRVRSPLAAAAGVGVAAACSAGLMLPTAGAVVAAVLAVVAVTAVLLRWSVAHVEADVVRQRAVLSERVLHLVEGARDLRLWGAQGRATDLVDQAATGLVRSARRSSARVGAARAVVAAATGTAVAVLAPPVASAVAAGRLLAPVAAALMLLPLALLDVLGPVVDAAATSVRTAAAARRLGRLARTAPAVDSPPVPVPLPTEGDLAARGLAGGWGTRPVFEGLDLQLRPGRRLGVVGPSGSGKSTLAATLVRFVDPVDGEVSTGGTPLRRLDLDDVHRRVGLLDDDPYVFSSSVLENVRLASPGAGRGEVEAALRTAALGDWLDALPEGLDTRVGAGGDAVSGGERARLGLARCLLADQPVLVLDEPTAHLDADTAHAVAADLLRASRDRAVVWITHDGVALADMDELVDLSSCSPLRRA